MIERYFPAGYTAASPEVARWLWLLVDARRRTLEQLEAIQQTALDWDGSPGRNSIGTLLYHIAAIEADWLFVEIREEDFPAAVKELFPWDVRDQTGRLSVVKDLSLEDHLDRLARTRDYLTDTVEELSLEEFRRVRKLPEYDVSPEWVLHHLMQHEAEHRGEIGEIRNQALMS